MKSNGCEKPEVFPLVEAHGPRPQLRDSSHLFFDSLLALIAPLANVINIWMLLHDLELVLEMSEVFPKEVHICPCLL
jgi:hypothetical protein